MEKKPADHITEIERPQKQSTYSDIKDGEKTSHNGYTIHREVATKRDTHHLKLIRTALAALTIAGGVHLGLKGLSALGEFSEAYERTNFSSKYDAELNGAAALADGQRMYKQLVVLPGDDGRNPAVRELPKKTYYFGKDTLIERVSPKTEISRGVMDGDRVIFKCQDISDEQVKAKTTKDQDCSIDSGLVRGTRTK